VSEGERERERQRDRETERQRETETERLDRQTDRQTDIGNCGVISPVAFITPTPHPSSLAAVKSRMIRHSVTGLLVCPGTGR